ncbi:alpha/beta hydrolase [Comamonas serinivorans]|nr:alpha/beta hydrolase [Comamonas serinivorans]
MTYFFRSPSSDRSPDPAASTRAGARTGHPHHTPSDEPSRSASGSWTGSASGAPTGPWPAALHAAATRLAPLHRHWRDRPGWQRAVIGGAASVALLHLSLCSYIYATQRHMLYKPQPRHLPAAENELRLDLDGRTLQITHRAATQAPPNEGLPGAARQPALIYFGGNAEDVSLQLKRFVRLWPHRDLYLVHYRGWGDSSGRPTQAGLLADALAVFDHVQARHDDVAVIGRSLGSGVAIQVAAQRPASALVLVTPYDSIANVAREQMPFWVPVRWLLKDRWESVLVAPRITVPTTVIQAEHDETIGAERTQRLFEAFAPGVAKLRYLPGVDHTSVLFAPAYHRMLALAIV